MTALEVSDMCNSATKKIAIVSRCNFFLHAMSCISHDREILVRLFKAHDCLEINSTFLSNIAFDDVFVYVHKNVSRKLRLIHEFITLRSSPRIIVLVDNAHVPTLKLLRAMGVVFIISLRDSFLNFSKFLQDSSIVRYMSPDLHAVIKSIQPAPAWTTEWGAFDGVQYLTPAETENILDLLQGMSPGEIAKKRYISVKTVSTHKLNALRKMELRVFSELFITPRS